MTDELHPALDVDDLGRVSLGVVGDQQQLHVTIGAARRGNTRHTVGWKKGRTTDDVAAPSASVELIPGQLEIGGAS